MLTAAENERLTRVGPGTPMGTLQRRYWHPIAAAEELAERWTKRVRLLGEDLVLFRDRSGKLGLVGEFCPHRHASLANGFPEHDGIRCPYHGWKFNARGRCVDQPNEPPESTFKDRVRVAGYRVELLGGMIFGYIGPEPAPLLPRWDGFVNEGVIRTIGYAHVACNWLQIMENSMDPVHTEWQHGKHQEFHEEQLGSKYHIGRKHLAIDFEEFEFGIYKRRLLDGAPEDSDDWKVGHPVLFPDILAVGSGGGDLWTTHVYQMRVPMDDENTMHYWYTAYVPTPDMDVPEKLFASVPLFEVPIVDERGETFHDNIESQDIEAWLAQGRIFDRTTEALGTTDVGVIRYRKMLEREMAKVERGEDPINVFRDPARNVVLSFPLERNKAHFAEGFANLQHRQYSRWSPFAADLVELFRNYNEQLPAGVV